MTSFPPDKTINDFWSWFQSVAPRLACNSKDSALLDELSERVEDLGELNWEIGPGHGKEHALVITPDGDSELLPVTRHIVSQAPTVPDWEFHSARPPKQWDLRFSVELSNGQLREFDARKWRYVAFQFPDGTLDLIIEEPNTAGVSEDDRWLASIILLDGLLGEATRLTFIGGLEIVLELPEEYAGHATPVERLPEHLDSLHN